mmetsp:Transcript_34214/g.68121  ORF Transcript_34214/g.68121 Transcript_34214/m.68121 type:complete len:258 (+) Transcript_34214:55-828(+)
MDLNISWITWCMKGCVSAHCSACASYNYFALAQCGDASFAKPACTQQQPSTASWSTKTVWSDVLTREMELDLQASGGGVASCSWSKRRTRSLQLDDTPRIHWRLCTLHSRRHACTPSLPNLASASVGLGEATRSNRLLDEEESETVEAIVTGSAMAALSSSGVRSSSMANAARTAIGVAHASSSAATRKHDDATSNGESKNSATLTRFSASESSITRSCGAVLVTATCNSSAASWQIRVMNGAATEMVPPSLCASAF